MAERHTTIVALSSGGLPSGIAVVRLSGPASRRSLHLLTGHVPEPRRLMLRTLRDEKGNEIDTGLVVFFPGPNSFTGEDCAELHVHGSRAVVASLVASLTAMGDIELAAAGDFTRRAFEAGKLDLTQVEGLGDLIAADTDSQRRQALERKRGWLGEEVGDWRGRIIFLRAEIEARIDFSDESDVPDALPEQFAADIAALRDQLKATLDTYGAGRIVREGFRVVIAGAPNAGKSSLLNALAGSDEAIVSPEAGTTRDVKEVDLDLGGQLIRLVDVAGLRHSESVAEAEGVRRAERAVTEADLVLWLEAPDVAPVARPAGIARLWVISSKADLSKLTARGDLAVSAKSGEGIAELKKRLGETASEMVSGEGMLISHLRDKESIERSLDYLAQAVVPGQADEIVAENLRLAGQALARLTGEIDAERILDRLFAGFCIGK